MDRQQAPFFCLALAVLVGPCAAVVDGQEPPTAAEIFTRSIAPLLETHCVRCHQGATARGGLSLETAVKALAGGDSGPALVAGKPAESLLFEMIAGDEPTMPKEGPPLAAAEVELIRRWIEAGAVWPAERTLTDRSGPDTWWSLLELHSPPVPQATSWCRTPIDAFIAERLSAEHLSPSAEASREVLLRRVTFDLHGLPPTTDEIDAFLADQRPDAWEHVADRLLASPRYGERWAQHWLDTVHYGDTHGYDKDKRRDNAWRYRDWVIDALNRDLPYGEFVTQQLAGDVLAPDDPQARIATGFVAAGPWDFVGQVELREGTIEKAKTLNLDRDDMVAATMGTFCSVTAHCARCHDHPFDPLPQRDHYRLQAVFAGVERGDVACPGPAAQAAAAALASQQQMLTDRIAAIAQREASLITPELTHVRQQLAALEQSQLDANPWDDSEQPASPTNGYHSALESRNDATKWVQLDLGSELPIEAIRLIPARPTDFPDTPGFGFPVRFQVAIASRPDLSDATVIHDATAADFVNPGALPVQFSAAGKAARYVRVTATQLWPRTNDYCFALAEVQVDAAGTNVAVEATVTALDSIDGGRWSMQALVDGFGSRHRLPELNDELRATLHALAARERDRAELQAQLATLETSLGLAQLRSDRQELLTQIDELQTQIDKTLAKDQVYAVRSREARPIFLLARGDVNQPGENIGPGAMAAIHALPSTFDLPPDSPEGARRLALAQWIVDRRNPLTWRSIVNRVWHYHFGRGLVDTPNDFGRNGSQPTHPELLDWLAAGFRDGGQSLKQLHRLIVTSAVYRQSAAADPERMAHDADNRLLWRANRRRLDAEELRDSMLAVSGQLDLTVGGPGYDLFRFKDDHSPIYDYASPEVQPSNRRSIYRFIVRSVQNPFFEVLDCADPSALTPKRNTTITALQALTLLNDPFVLRQAEQFSAQLAAASPELNTQLAMAVRRAWGRSPREAEAQLLADYAARYGLAATCRLLFNANEFVFVD